MGDDGVTYNIIIIMIVKILFKCRSIYNAIKSSRFSPDSTQSTGLCQKSVMDHGELILQCIFRLQ